MWLVYLNFKKKYVKCINAIFFFTDIVFSSAGWVSVNTSETETAHFYAWTPNQRGLYVRKPSLLPYAASLYRGKRKLFSPAYSRKEPTVVRY